MSAQQEKCEIIRPLMSVFVDGEATAAEATLVETHVDGCGPCASHMAFLRAVNLALAGTPEMMPSAAMHARIAAATYARPSLASRLSHLLRPSFPARLALGSAVAVGIVAVVVWTRPLDTTGVKNVPGLPSQVTSDGSERATVAASARGGKVSPGSAPSSARPNAAAPVAAKPTASLASSGGPSAASSAAAAARLRGAADSAAAAIAAGRDSAALPTAAGSSVAALRKTQPGAAKSTVSSSGKQAAVMSRAGTTAKTASLRAGIASARPGRAGLAKNGGAGSPSSTTAPEAQPSFAEIRPTPAAVPQTLPENSIPTTPAVPDTTIKVASATPPVPASSDVDSGPLEGNLRNNGVIRLSVRKGHGTAIIPNALNRKAVARNSLIGDRYSITDGPGGQAPVVEAPAVLR